MLKVSISRTETIIYRGRERKCRSESASGHVRFVVEIVLVMLHDLQHKTSSFNRQLRMTNSVLFIIIAKAL